MTLELRILGSWEKLPVASSIEEDIFRGVAIRADIREYEACERCEPVISRAKKETGLASSDLCYDERVEP